MAEEQVTRFADFKSSGYQEPGRKSFKSRLPNIIAAILALTAIVSGAAYIGTQELRSPDFLG